MNKKLILFICFFLKKLDKKLRENLRDPRNSLFSSDSMATGALSFQRPLLVILDRSTDLASLLHHTWTYQALAHDVLVRTRKLFC